MANQNSQASAGGLFRSASILSIGNLASRILGLLREAVIARYFGTEGVDGVASDERDKLFVSLGCDTWN